LKTIYDAYENAFITQHSPENQVNAAFKVALKKYNLTPKQFFTELTKKINRSAESVYVPYYHEEFDYRNEVEEDKLGEELNRAKHKELIDYLFIDYMKEIAASLTKLTKLNTSYEIFNSVLEFLGNSWAIMKTTAHDQPAATQKEIVNLIANSMIAIYFPTVNLRLFYYRTDSVFENPIPKFLNIDITSTLRTTELIENYLSEIIPSDTAMKNLALLSRGSITTFRKLVRDWKNKNILETTTSYLNQASFVQAYIDKFKSSADIPGTFFNELSGSLNDTFQCYSILTAYQLIMREAKKNKVGLFNGYLKAFDLFGSNTDSRSLYERGLEQAILYIVLPEHVQFPAIPIESSKKLTLVNQELNEWLTKRVQSQRAATNRVLIERDFFKYMYHYIPTLKGFIFNLKNSTNLVMLTENLFEILKNNSLVIGNYAPSDRMKKNIDRFFADYLIQEILPIYIHKALILNQDPSSEWVLENIGTVYPNFQNSFKRFREIPSMIDSIGAFYYTFSPKNEKELKLKDEIYSQRQKTLEILGRFKYQSFESALSEESLS